MALCSVKAQGQLYLYLISLAEIDAKLQLRTECVIPRQLVDSLTAVDECQSLVRLW
jgi:hypothetical protein